MTQEHRRHRRRHPSFAQMMSCAVALIATQMSPAVGQDVPGLEVCTVEKQIDRRTGCLQSNVDFLQQTLTKLARDTQDKIAAANRDLASARAEIAALRSTIAKLTGDLEQMKMKVDSAGKK